MSAGDPAAAAGSEVNDAIRQQAIRRRGEMMKIAMIASTPCTDLHDKDFDQEVSKQQQCASNEADKENEQHSCGAAAAAAAGEGVNNNHNNETERSITPTRARPTSASSAASSCRSPTEENTTVSQLKNRVAMLEEESEQLRTVVSLCRRENAALKSVLDRVATATLGVEWKAKCNVNHEEGVLLAGCGQPSQELTMAQRERLIGLLNGDKPSLLP